MEQLAALLAVGLLIISLVATVAVGIYISESRGRNPAEGVALGCLLGPLGYWIALLLPDRTPPVAPYVPLELRPIGTAPADPEPARPGARYFVGASPEDAARQARDWCRERQNSGFLVTETVWMDPDRRTLAVAIGRPGQPYARRWPDRPDESATILGDAAVDHATVTRSATDAQPPATHDGPARI